MSLRLFGLSLFFGVALFALREAWLNYKTGSGYMGKGLHANRKDAPFDFWWGIGWKIGCAILFSAVGLYFFFNPAIVRN